MSHADTIKTSISAKDFCHHYGITVNRSGFCRCLFHDDRNASMKVYDGRRGFYCFSCHAGGTVIDLAMKYHSCDFKTVIHLLNDDFSLGLDLDVKPDPNQKQRQQLDRAVRDIAELLRERREDAYWAAFDRWFDNEKVIMQHRPEPSQAFSDWDETFCEAVHKRASLFQELMILEERRNKSYGRN